MKMLFTSVLLVFSVLPASPALARRSKISPQKQCEAKGGEWKVWTKADAVHETHTCRVRAKDAGKHCMDGKECSTHRCEVRPGGKGACTEYSGAEGCHAWMEGGRPGPEICVD